MKLIILPILFFIFSIYYLSKKKRRDTLFGKILKSFSITLAVWLYGLIFVINAGYGWWTIVWLWLLPPGYLFYLLNLFWLIPMFSKNNKKPMVYINEFLILLCLFVLPFIIIHQLGRQSIIITIQLIIVTAVISFFMSWFIYHRNKEKIQQLLSLKKELGKTTSDLQFLRSQINPHFLFNSLNTLYGISMQENAAKTGDGIQKLGDMMRFMLHDNQQDLIPLSKELSYLKDYIYLQQLRLEENENIKIDINITECPDTHYIAPMLLIPFVENTFKHGISLQEKSWVKIDLRCDETKLFFETANSAHPKTIHDPEKNKSGIGLDNVKQRLQLLYPGKYDLMIRETPQEFFVHLSLTLS
ncbi:MAG: histidine kinase [Chitinophagaceae bacterium]|nr:MAG: histidine kinase [Chitinophagaceae bacterium]